MCKFAHETIKKTLKSMRNYIVFGLLLMSLALAACGDKAKGGAGPAADSTQVAGTSGVADDERHTEAYIRQRIESIYSHFGYSASSRGPEGEGMPAVNYDSLYCSTRYLELLEEAKAISRREGTICIDADHWIVGQDVDKEWRYELKEVRHITDSTAEVELMVHNFSDNKVVLDLFFEHASGMSTTSDNTTTSRVLKARRKRCSTVPRC